MISQRESAPRVALVTVTYNSAKVLPDFLDSVEALTGIKAELFVVDNASSDATVEIVRARETADTIVIVNSDNRGVAAANNQGIEAAMARGHTWVMLLNNDTYFDAGTISTLLDEAMTSGARIITPLIAASEPAGSVWFSEGHLVPWQGFRAFHDGVGELMSLIPEHCRPTGYASTCALLVHTDVFREIGLMDPVYFVYFDDVDFAARALRNGFEYWITTRASITHKASSLTGGKHSDFTIQWTSRNWPLVALRNLDGVKRIAALAFIQSWIVGRFLLRVDTVEMFLTRQRGFVGAFRDRSAPPPRFPAG